MMKNKVMYIFSTITVFLFFSTPLQAKDLGVGGSVWEITEQDIRVRMSNDAAKVDWDAKNKEIIDDAGGFLDRQKKWSVPTAETDSKKLVDISQELTEDMMGYEPKEDGTFAKKVIFKKGYRFNPLERMNLDKGFVVINGKSEAQIKWAKSLHESMPGKFVFVSTDGLLSELNNNSEIPFYPVSEWLFVTAGVQRVPAVVGVSESRKDRLTVFEMALPYTVEKVIEAMK